MRLLNNIAALLFAVSSSVGMGQGFNPDSKSDTSGATETDVRPADVIHWQPLGATLDKSGLLTFNLRLVTEEGWTLYKDKIKFEAPKTISLESSKGPEPIEINDPMSGHATAVYGSGEFELRYRNVDPIVPDKISLDITYVGCTVKICLFPHTETLIFPVFAEKGTAVAKVIAENRKNDEASKDAATTAGVAQVTPGDSAPTSGDIESDWAKQLKTGGFSLGMILLVFLGGLLTNFTPCVFPMIPITIRLLGSQGSSALLSSVFYALGILLTYTGLGLGAAMSGALFGSLLASNAFNVVFGFFMLILGATMLGFGDLSFIQQFGSRIGAGKPSLRNSFLMGCGAGLVAAPCTGPILAALLAYTAERQEITKGALMLFVYSGGFAIPYVFLGTSAAKVSKFKLPPQWQVAVKFLFAGVMFGLFFYYMRIPAYRFMGLLKPYWMSITLALLPSAILLTALWVMSPTLQANKILSLIPTLLLGFGTFSFSQAISSAGSLAMTSGPTLQVLHSEAEGFAIAKETGKPILLDAWAEWCEACKKMDKTTFADPRVIELLSKKWVVIKLDLTESNDENDAVIQKYGIPSLPTLTLLPPTADIAKKKPLQGYTTADVLLQELNQFRGE